MSSPRFTVPASDRIANPATQTDPAEVGEDIAHLPYADLNRVARTLLNALTLLNRHPEKVPARADIMAAYRVPCARLVKAVPNQGSSPDSREMRQLMQEMAYGYKHLINEALSGQSRLKQRARLGQGLYFAAKYLSLELFLGFETYQCKVANSWRELMAMYRLAEEQNLHHAPVEDREQPEPANATVAHTLKRIVLLRLQDPCRMVPGEARACFDFLNLHASEALLENLDGSPNQAGRFLLDLESVELPRAPDADTLPRNPERFRYFNLLPVSRSVHGQLQRLEAHGGDGPEALQRLRELSPALVMKRMLKAWHGRSERRDNREETFGWMLCGCGLSAVNHFLLPTEEDSTNVVDGEPVEMPMVGALGHRPAQYLRIRCRQVNRSPSGLCIRLQLPSELKPKVGQVVMLMEDRAGRDGEPSTGIVRRRTSIDGETLEAGIQLIRGVVKPVAVCHMIEQGQMQPALWVERERPQFNSILLTPGRFAPGDSLRLLDDEGDRTITIGDRVETTPSFERFRIRFG